ncbi:MAG: DGQHR domain-containing protein [Bacilli bacterium]|nr:DGQHR domain-containing protein [Bacilli bacterium]
MMKLLLLRIDQPIGTFYYGKLRSDLLSSISYSNERKLNSGNQRRLRQERLKEIEKYCSDPDAAFPTPIIIAISDTAELVQSSFAPDLYEYAFEESELNGEVLDGQHRLNGIIKSGMQIELPVVFMFNLTEEEKAYIFSTINSNQQKVDKSLIYDLFELSESRSPYKTCHDIARMMNSDVDSPFYSRLKMLETRTSEYESLSQGTFVRYLSTLITSSHNSDYIDIKNGKKIEDDSKYPLRFFFINNNDDVIYKILFNCFCAAKAAFLIQWNHPKQYILTKTTGFGAIIKSLKVILPKMLSEHDVSQKKFSDLFTSLKNLFDEEGLDFVSTNFPPSEMGEQKLSSYIIVAFEKI